MHTAHGSGQSTHNGGDNIQCTHAEKQLLGDRERNGETGIRRERTRRCELKRKRHRGTEGESRVAIVCCKNLNLARTFNVLFVRARKPRKNGIHERTNVGKRESGYGIMDKRDNGVTKVELLHGIIILQK